MSGFGGFNFGGPSYGGMFRGNNMFGGVPGQRRMGLSNPLPGMGRGIGNWWEGLGDNKAQVIAAALGGLGNFMEGRAERGSREKMHGAEMDLATRQQDYEEAERKRKRDEWMRYLMRNGLGG